MIKEEVRNARARGISSEKLLDMLACTVDSMIEDMEESNPEVYEKIIHEIHEKITGPHYDKAWADIEVQNLEYTNREKQHASGPHWTMEQVLEATRGKSFPSNTTEWDKYVAYNAAYADFCTKFDDQQILDIAFLFFFADEDWTSEGKIWHYMAANK